MANARILIVEDEGIEALDIQSRLMNLGYPAPDIVFSGEEAIKRVEANVPDLVLMDIMLPGDIDGVTAAEQIRAHCDVPIIYLTAYADEDTLERAKITEPYGYIVKPFNERELHITIDVALYKHEMARRLRESERWLATTLRSIGDAVIATDRDGRVTFMNPVAERLTGWKTEEALHRKLTDVFKIISRATRQPVENPAARVLREGVIVGLANHTRLIARDGSEVPIDDSAAPIRDDGHNVIGVILVFRDITEREKAEEDLGRAHGIVHAAMDAIISVDEGQRVLLFNAAAEQVFRCPAAEALGQPLDRFIPAGSRGTHRRHVEEFGRHGVTSRRMGALGEVTGLRADGEVFPAEAAISRTEAGGQKLFTVILRDITERKQAEDQLHQTLAEKEAALADKEALVREVHHRTKNNLQMLCDLLYLQAETLEPGEGKSALEDASRRIYAIARLHEQLYQSLQSGRIRLDEYLARLVAGFKDLYPQVAVRLETPGDDLSLDLDRAIHVGLVANELLTNALKHAFPSGQPGEVTVGLRRVGDQLELQVRDTGKGLPPHLHLEQTTTTLGLRIVQTLARRLRAVIRVERHQGTAVTLTFPFAAE